MLTSPDVKHRFFDSNRLSNRSVADELPFFATRPVDDPNRKMVTRSKDFIRQSMHLLPNHQHLSARDIFKSIDKTNLPKVIFTLSMSMPTVAVAGKILPLYLGLKHNIAVEQESYISVPPQILLRDVAVVIGVGTGIASPEDLSGDWYEEKELASASYPKDSMPMTQNTDIGKMLEPTVPSDFVPTFRLSNLGRDYTLIVRVSADCAGKTFKAEFTAEHLLLWPSLYVPHSGKALETGI